MNIDNTSEIILPNGKQAKEVIGPDGSTIWQKEADIPDSAIYRVPLDDVNGNVAETIEGLTGTNNGVTSVTNDYQGGSAGEGNGVDDHIAFNEFTQWTENRTSAWAVGFTVDNWTGPESGQDTTPRVIGTSDGDFNEVVGVDLNRDDDGQVTCEVQVSDDRYRPITDDVTIDDGNKHRVLVGVDADDGSFAAFVDTNSESMSIDSDDGPSTSTDPIGADTVAFATSSGSDTTQHFGGVLDDIFVYGTLPDASLAQQDYDLQPWA